MFSLHKIVARYIPHKRFPPPTATLSRARLLVRLLALETSELVRAAMGGQAWPLLLLIVEIVIFRLVWSVLPLQGGLDRGRNRWHWIPGCVGAEDGDPDVASAT